MLAPCVRWSLLLVVARAVDIQNAIVSKTGCTCVTECGMSYQEPHHDTHFCHVDMAECTEGCDCHLERPDKDGRPWDLCDPSHTMQLAWMEAPAFTREAEKSATSGAGEQVTEAKEKAALARNASSAAKKQLELALKEMAAAKQQIKQVQSKDFLALSEEREVSKKTQHRLTMYLAISLGIAICGLASAASMIPRFWRAASATHQLDEANVQVSLLKQENAHLSQSVDELRDNITEQRNLLMRHQDVVMELAKCESGVSLPAFARKASRSSLASSTGSLFVPLRRQHSKKWIGTESTASSDLDEPCYVFRSGSSASTRLDSQCDREATLQSLLSSCDTKTSLPLERENSMRSENGASLVPPLNLQAVEDARKLSPQIASSGLQEQLLSNSAWQKIGDEAWKQQEIERNVDANCGSTQGSGSTGDPETLEKQQTIADIDGVSVCSEQSGMTSNSASWWGGKSFVQDGHLPSECSVSAREARLLAKKKTHAERFVIHTPANLTARSIYER